MKILSNVLYIKKGTNLVDSETADKLVYLEEYGTWKDHLIVDGRVVPNITIKHDNLIPEDLYLVVNERFAMKLESIEELERWGWILAHAMAIAAGWTCFGDENTSVRYNPYGVHAPVVADYKDIDNQNI